MLPSILPWKTLSATLGFGVLDEHWNLAEALPGGGDVARTFTHQVEFATAFEAPPVVQLALTGFDIDQRDSSRLSIKASEITTHGFQIEITTWLETRVYAVECSWFAIGA